MNMSLESFPILDIYVSTHTHTHTHTQSYIVKYLKEENDQIAKVRAHTL